MTSPNPRHSNARSRSTLLAVIIACSFAGLIVGCGDKNAKDKGATQTAAKVNKEEITVHQINFVLSQQRGLPPEQAASASRAVLERLIDQEVILQKAGEQKIDRDPRVVQQIEAARREIIAKAYVDKIGQGAPKATAPEVAAYYEAHPALFKERKVYSLQEANIEATTDQVTALREALAASKTFLDFVNYLKTNGFKYSGTDAVRGAEQLPLSEVDRFAKLADGAALVNQRPGGLQVVSVARVRSQPVSLQQATPAIEQFLLNERKRKLIADDLAALRGAAKIEYVGSFEAEAAKSPYVAPSAPELPVTTLAPTLPASAVNAAPQVEAARPDSAPASMPSGETLDKGLKGLK